MRWLESEEIEKFAGRKGVRRIAVENFLMSMGDDEYIASMNMIQDTQLYRWNRETIKAIKDGINLASRG